MGMLEFLFFKTYINSLNSFAFIGFSDKPIKVPKDVVNKPKEVSCPKPKSKAQETLISIINVINDIL